MEIEKIVTDDYCPKISIALTCYNSAPYLKAAIKSILRQTYKNWEIIFVEDCSTDETLARVEEYIKAYALQDKSKIIRHDKNMGYGTALKRAIEEGSGELVAVIDSDDALGSKYAFSTMIRTHKIHPEASLCYSTYFCCRNVLATDIVKEIVPIPKGKTYLDSLLNPFSKNGKNRYCRVSHLKVFKRACYDKTEGLKAGLVKAVDRDLVLKLEETGSLIYVNKPLYFHRKHKGNITNNWGNLTEAEKNAIRAAKRQMIDDAKKRRGLV